MVAVAIGIFAVTVFNPVASILRNRYDGLESRVLKGRTSDLALSRTGLWLRQQDAARARPSSMPCGSPPTTAACSR